jgi:hypothetical protein
VPIKKEPIMYQLEYDDLYDPIYDPYDDSESYRYADACIVSLIEEIYCSEKINHKEIATSLNGLIREFHSSQDANVKESDITVTYECPMQSFEESFNAWLDCIDPITGELNYTKLCDTDRGFALKEFKVFNYSLDALEALVAQLTTQMTFSDGILSGALICLASRYGVKFMDAINYKANIVRGKQ